MRVYAEIHDADLDPELFRSVSKSNTVPRIRRRRERRIESRNPIVNGYSYVPCVRGPKLDINDELENTNIGHRDGAGQEVTATRAASCRAADATNAAFVQETHYMDMTGGQKSKIQEIHYMNMTKGRKPKMQENQYMDMTIGRKPKTQESQYMDMTKGQKSKAQTQHGYVKAEGHKTKSLFQERGVDIRQLRPSDSDSDDMYA